MSRRWFRTTLEDTCLRCREVDRATEKIHGESARELVTKGARNASFLSSENDPGAAVAPGLLRPARCKSDQERRRRRSITGAGSPTSRATLGSGMASPKVVAAVMSLTATVRLVPIRNWVHCARFVMGFTVIALSAVPSAAALLVSVGFRSYMSIDVEVTCAMSRVSTPVKLGTVEVWSLMAVVSNSHVVVAPSDP